MTNKFKGDSDGDSDGDKTINIINTIQWLQDRFTENSGESLSVIQIEIYLVRRVFGSSLTQVHILKCCIYTTIFILGIQTSH